MEIAKRIGLFVGLVLVIAGAAYAGIRGTNANAAPTAAPQLLQKTETAIPNATSEPLQLVEVKLPTTESGEVQ